MDETDGYLNIMDSGGSIIKINGVGNTYPTILIGIIAAIISGITGYAAGCAIGCMILIICM